MERVRVTEERHEEKVKEMKLQILQLEAEQDRIKKVNNDIVQLILIVYRSGRIPALNMITYKQNI